MKLPFFSISKLVLAILLLSLCLFSFQDRNALAGKSEQDSDELSELRIVNQNQAVYESQLSELIQKSIQLENQLKEKQSRLRKIKSSIQKLEKKILADKTSAEMMRLERQQIISELYILTDDPLYFVISFIDIEEFMNRLHGKDEDMIVVREKISEIVNLNGQIREVLSDQKKLVVKKLSYSSQIEKIDSELTSVREEIVRKQGGGLVAGASNFNLEAFLIGLDKEKSLAKREFISWNSATGPVFEFVGGGTEHGLGLSQYGAKGLAERGKNYQDIIKYYFRGVSVSKINTNPKIRVLISSQIPSGKLKIVSGQYKMGKFTLNQGDYLSFSSRAAKVVRNKEVVKNISSPKMVQLKPVSNGSKVKVLYKKNYFNDYFGEIKIVKEGSGFSTLNVLPIEEYLKGVVVAEMPSSWPLEALKAQSLAARSYAIRHIKKDAIFDVDDTTAYQVFLGALRRPSSTKAVGETRGLVVTYNGNIIPTYYFSTSGGYTENNENVWGGKPIPYLRGVASPWEKDSPWWTWYSKKYTRKELSKIFSTLGCGTIKKIKILNRGVSGRVLAVELYGSKKNITVSGMRFKGLLNANLSPDDDLLRSTLFGVRSIK